MSEERNGDDLLDPFPVPATDDVLSDGEAAEPAPEDAELDGDGDPAAPA